MCKNMKRKKHANYSEIKPNKEFDKTSPGFTMFPENIKPIKTTFIRSFITRQLIECLKIDFH